MILSRSHLRRLLVVAALLPAGCSSENVVEVAGDSITPRYEPAASDFFRVPWPSDHRVLADGTVDLTDFPDAEFPVVASIRAALEGTVVGFSTMPVVYVELDRDPGAEALLTPAESLAEGAAVQLVAVGPEHCGQRVPVEMAISQTDSQYLRSGVLQVSPVPGFALRQGEPYALVVLRDFGAPVGLTTQRPEGWDELFAGTAESPLGTALAPLRACAATGAVDLDAVAIATVFTTQDVLGQARALRDAVRDPDYVDAPAISGWATSEAYTSASATSYVATYQTPIFQEGESPYQEEGGAILFEGGRPVVQRWEAVPMIVTVPEGEGPFPVVLWIDGTGWSDWTHVNDSLTRDLLDAGFAIASYMPQFHGSRATPGSDEELSTYNFLNPSAGRNVLRQQLADTSYFLRVLEAVASIEGAPLLDTSRVVFGGQSQGAQNGAMLAAVEPDVHAYVLNGLAAYLTIAVLERKDGADFESLLKVVLGIKVEIDRFYPALHLLQLGADSVDPQNYAAGWSGWPGKTSGANLFVLNGQADDTTHPIGMSAITIAGDLAPIAPPGWEVDPYGVWPRSAEPLPIAGNRTALDDSAHTLATYLDATTGHFTIYERPVERARAVDFLVQARSGPPSVR